MTDVKHFKSPQHRLRPEGVGNACTPPWFDPRSRSRVAAEWEAVQDNKRPAGQALCQHSLVELHGCDPAQLRAAGPVKSAVVRAVKAGGGTIVESVFHRFQPYGVSGVVVITESHVTIHTWPEHGYAALDIFSCSECLDHGRIARLLADRFRARRAMSRTFARGVVAAPTPEKPAGSRRPRAPRRRK